MRDEVNVEDEALKPILLKQLPDKERQFILYVFSDPDKGERQIAKEMGISDQTEYIEYVCNTYHRFGKKYCPSHRIKEDVLDELLYAEIKALQKKAASNWKKLSAYAAQYLAVETANQSRIQAVKEEIRFIEEEIKGLYRLMAKFEDQEEMLVITVRENEEQIKALKKRIEQYSNAEIMSIQKQERLQESLGVLNEIVEQGIVSKGSIHLLIEKILIKQDEDMLDVEFVLKGAFESHSIIYETFRISKRNKADLVTTIEIIQEIA